MKHLRFLAALCCMLAVFTACEKNDLNDNSNGNGINTDQNSGSSNTGDDTDQNDGNSNSGYKKATGTANGHEWVDLDLPSGLKWATCNVGATKPEECGNYYAWGETTPKDYYDWNNYKYGWDEVTKYCCSPHGIVDDKTVLDPEDDAAAVNWGGAWRMPTEEEWYELISYCTCNDGWVIGPNGYSICFPRSFRYGDDLYRTGIRGYYWSSSVDVIYSFNACAVGFF